MEQNKINGQLYRQVFVKNEADLPKEDRRYYFHLRGNFDLTSCLIPSAKYNQIKKRIGWYLIESPELTDEIQAIRKAIANYMYSEGCSCCQDRDAHQTHKEILAKLLDVKPYSYNSGYDFSSYRG